MNKSTLILFLRILVGAVFVFSGFVKAVDPLGFTYKMEDYLAAMGPFFESFGSLAFVASIVLSALEFVLGVNLIMGNRLKETLWASGFFMLVMTPLTLWIALANPVHDCGCFGDALVITNWETFWKNIVISLVLLGIFFLRKSNKPFVLNKSQWFLTFFAFAFSTGLSLYCFMHLPIIDFRPYKIGTNIIEGMQIPEDAPQDSTVTTLTYSKNGVVKAFVFPDYPKDDSTWVFVDSKTEVIVKGYEPPIHDFTMDDLDEGEVTDLVLQNPSYTFLLVAYDFSKADISKSEQINKIYQFAQDNGYGFYAMTASVDEDIEAYKEDAKAEYPIALTDKITLKTMIRSNPGLILIKNATVLNMWHVNDLPEFKESLDKSPLGQIQKPNLVKRIGLVALLFLIPVLLIVGLDNRERKNNN